MFLNIKQNKIFILAIVLSIFVTSTNCFCNNKSVEPITQEEIDAEQQSLDLSKTIIKQIQNDKKKVKSTIKSLKNKKNNTEQYIKALDDNLDLLNTEILQVNSNIATKNAEMLITQNKLDIAIEIQKEQLAGMNRRIKYLYELGDLNFINVLIGSTDIVDFLSRQDYIKDLSKYDRDKLNQFKETVAVIEFQKQKLKAEQDALQALHLQQNEKKESIETLISSKTEELTNTQKELNLTEAELKKLEQAEKQQDAIISQIEAKIKARNSNRVLKGGFIWPCPSTKMITSPFGNRKSPTKGASTFHKGIDIGAKSGANVVAAADGEVVIVDYNYSSGKYIMIDHGSGVFTIYMHLSSQKVKTGDEVKQGDVIGLVGSTGISTGPHLHFGVRRDGTYVDPQQYV